MDDDDDDENKKKHDFFAKNEQNVRALYLYLCLVWCRDLALAFSFFSKLWVWVREEESDTRD